MEKEKILKYAQQFLGDKAEKLRENLESDTLSPFQKRKFELKLREYMKEYDEVSEMLKGL